MTGQQDMSPPTRGVVPAQESRDRRRTGRPAALARAYVHTRPQAADRPAGSQNSNPGRPPLRARHAVTADRMTRELETRYETPQERQPLGPTGVNQLSRTDMDVTARTWHCPGEMSWSGTSGLGRGRRPAPDGDRAKE